MLSQTYRRAAEGQKGQAATDNLNDHSILPGAKVMEMGDWRTRPELSILSFKYDQKNVFIEDDKDG